MPSQACKTCVACTLSVVIAHRNGVRMLTDCLDSLYRACRDLDIQVIVVDNASTDDSVARLRHDYHAVEVIENKRNVGFAAATNQGLKRAAGRFLMLLNNDTVVLDGAPERMLRVMETHSRIGAIGPRLLNRDGSVQPSCMPFPSLWRNPLTFLSIEFPTRASASGNKLYAPAKAIKGACMVIRQEALSSVGMLDEGYFMYGEESDWCFRALKQGWEIAHVPDAAVVHLGGQTASREPSRFYVERRRSHIRFMLKHYGILSARADALLFRLAIVLHATIHRTQRSFYSGVLPEYDAMVSDLLSGADTSADSSAACFADHSPKR